MTITARLALGAIRLYQLTLSSMTGGACRFVPSCSAYAAEAIQVHGALRGGLLALRRLARCHPLGGHGLDPVPPHGSPQPASSRHRPLCGSVTQFSGSGRIRAARTARPRGRGTGRRGLPQAPCALRGSATSRRSLGGGGTETGSGAEPRLN